MSSLQSTSPIFEPIESPTPGNARLRGTPWAKSPSAQVFYRFVEFVAKALTRAGVSADAITYASLLFAVTAGVAAGIGHPGKGAIFVLLSGTLDLLDGAVARTSGSASRWGALLDSTLDRVSDAAPLAGVVVFYSHVSWAAAIPLLAIVAGFVISYVRARAEALGTKLPTLHMRRAERGLLVAASLGLGTLIFEGGIAAPLMLAGVALTGILSVGGVLSILVSAHRAMKLDAA